MKKKSEDTSLAQDLLVSKVKTENKILKKKTKTYLKRIKELEKSLEVRRLNRIDTHDIKLPVKSNSGEAVAFIIASDWHLGELVRPEMISGLNKFNPKIAKERCEKFFRNALKLYRITSRDIEVKRIVLALLGDFIYNNLHEDSGENATMLPMEEMMFAQAEIASGIQFLLDNTDCKITVPCCTGNHARTTKRVHISSEFGSSLEYYMYHNLADHFRDEKRVQFNIAKGYHIYIEVFGSVIRLHHGHFIRYNGGVGGIYIPVNKAIAQWNKMKKADLDILAHYHQFRDGGNFICNGSLIGYNAYALSIKADYEPPKQAFFLFDKKRGKTIVAPIMVNGFKGVK